jgi:hypothetical protein
MTEPRDNAPEPLPGQLGLFGAPKGVAVGQRWVRLVPLSVEESDGLNRVDVITLDAGGVLVQGMGGRQEWTTAEALQRDYRRDS